MTTFDLILKEEITVPDDNLQFGDNCQFLLLNYRVEDKIFKELFHFFSSNTGRKAAIYL